MKVRSLVWRVMAVLATGVAFIAYLALRFENVRLSAEVDEARREHRQLSEKHRLYALEAQTLRERNRVRAIAERSLGMAAPDLGRVVDMAEMVDARGLPARERMTDGTKHARGAGRSR